MLPTFCSTKKQKCHVNNNRILNKQNQQNTHQEYFVIQNKKEVFKKKFVSAVSNWYECYRDFSV